MGVQQGMYRRLVLRLVIDAVQQVHGAVKQQRFLLRPQQVRRVFQRPCAEILVIKAVHLLAAVLFHGQHLSEGSSEIILRPIAELLFAECDQRLCGGVRIGLRHDLRGSLRQGAGGGLLAVPLFHEPQDAVKNSPLIFVVLIQGRGLDAHSLCDLVDADGLISLFRKQLYRFKQNFFLCRFTFHHVLQKLIIIS